MSIPVPRFEIGQTVFAVEVEDEPVIAECPDCKGSKKWTATSPAGERFEFPCPRCTGHDAWKLRHNKAVPRVRRLTIGSVRVDSGDDDRPVTYMCVETGIGSGTLWDEKRLAATEDEVAPLGVAAVAKREVWRATEIERLDRNSGWGPAGMKQRLETAVRYQPWTVAAITEAQSKAWAADYRYERLCNALAEVDEYGGIDGLEPPILGKIIDRLAEDAPEVKAARETVLEDRVKA